MRHCAKCGAEVSDEDRFCLRCGEPLDTGICDAPTDEVPDAVPTESTAAEDDPLSRGRDAETVSDQCCRYGFRAIGLGILAGILVMLAFAYQSAVTVDLAAGGLHFGVGLGDETLSLLDIGFGGLGSGYYVPTFIVLFFAALSLYSPVFGMAGSVSGLAVATYLDGIVFTDEGQSSAILPGLDELDSGVSATLELDDIGFVYLVLILALVLSIVGYWYLHRASAVSGTEGLFETQIKAWRNRFRSDGVSSALAEVRVQGDLEGVIGIGLLHL